MLKYFTDTGTHLSSEDHGCSEKCMPKFWTKVLTNISCFNHNTSFYCYLPACKSAKSQIRIKGTKSFIQFIKHKSVVQTNCPQTTFYTVQNPLMMTHMNTCCILNVRFTSNMVSNSAKPMQFPVPWFGYVLKCTLKWNHICKFILDACDRASQLRSQLLWLFNSCSQCLCAEFNNLYKE